MTQERFLIAQPIRSLQHMLGELSHEDSRLPFVAPDGIFGEKTLEAVMVFQREFSPPVTGRVDQCTWDAVVKRYLQRKRGNTPPHPLVAFPPPSLRAAPVTQEDALALSRLMFFRLSRLLEEITPYPSDPANLTASSAHNIRWLQQRAGLEETGTLDPFTWNLLTRLYTTFITRQNELKNCTKQL